MDDRIRQLELWLSNDCGLLVLRLEPASEDASFRRYLRISRDAGDTLIAMDAPPDREDCRPFVAIAARLEQAGLHVPHIHAADLEQGFVLLEDLGSTPYLQALSEATADRLYGDAIDALVTLQQAGVWGLPPYDEALLRRELQLFPDWLLERHLGLVLSDEERRMLDETSDLLVESALEQPVVCVHRDYHSRNLMVVDAGNPGIIDFQDAVAGPITYDLVSLLRDCYIRWPAERVELWMQGFHDRIGGSDLAQFRRWFDRMGVQRHLKAAGIFARLNHRDGKSGYLADIPRTLGYIVDVARHDKAIRPLAALLQDSVLPRVAATSGM